MRASPLVLVVLAAGCAAAAGAGPLDREVGLREGERTAVDGGRLTVGVKDVPSDSRCPADVVCVRAGEATVVLTLEARGRAPAEDTLQTAAGNDAVAYGGYRVQLLDVDPKPRSGGSPPEAYRVRLRIVRE
jgi:hypothetical protein